MRKDSQAEARRLGRPTVFAVSLASLLCIQASSALAVGLGDITLHSALGQPLDADIQLVDTQGLDADDLRVTLASSDVFAKSGVERPFFLTDLRFTPNVRGNTGSVRVQSNKPVTEPYLSFIVRLARNNGDQFHDYTLLIDPPNSAAGQAATRTRDRQPQAPSSAVASTPVAPPNASQGKRYTAVTGDSLASIARRVQPASGQPSIDALSRGIIALNPQVFPKGRAGTLKAGQSLLLPDAASLPTQAPPVGDAAPATVPAPNTAAAVENQQLVKMVDELSIQNQTLKEQLDTRDRKLAELQARLDSQVSTGTPPTVTQVAAVDTVEQIPEQPRADAASPPAGTPVANPAPAVQPQPAPAPGLLDDVDGLLPILAGLAVLLLLLALAFSVRRNRLRSSQPRGSSPAMTADALLKPAQSAPVTPVFEVPQVSTRPAAVAPSSAASQRLAGAATDALDGASIYIAYGRFNEALAILRDAMAREPERIDLRTRVLELLGETGDREGFDEQERILLEQGVEAENLQAIRARYPKLAVASAPPAASAAAVVAPAAVVAVDDRTSPTELDETAAAAVHPEQEDDFQLNLDELSMDANWDLVDPFDQASNRSAPEAPVTLEDDFSTNLSELPEVTEMPPVPDAPEERFLSDFAEPEQTLEVEALPVIETLDDDLEDAFLDSFVADEPHEFDLLDLEDEPLSPLNQAQLAIDDGDWDEARRLLTEVLDDPDEAHRRTARDLLENLP